MNNLPSALLILDHANIVTAFANRAPREIGGAQAQIDLNKLGPFLGAVTHSSVTEKIACTHTSPDRDKYMHLMHNCGYNLVSRPLRTFSDGEGGLKNLCNMDAEVAVESMMRASDHDTVIIGSGDADFVPLVESLRDQGKKVFIASHAAGLSGDLAAAAGGRVIDLGVYHRSIRLNHRNPVPYAGPPAPIKSRKNEIGDNPSSGQTALLVDGQFLSGSFSDIGEKVDFRKFAQMSQDRFGPIAVAKVFDRASPTRSQFQATLARDGWSVRAKEPKRDDTCSVAVDMCVAAIEAARNGHSVVLCTGGGQMKHLVTRLRENGCEVGLAAPTKQLSNALRASFSDEEFINMTANSRALRIGGQTGYSYQHAVRSVSTPKPQVNFDPTRGAGGIR